MFCHIVQHGDVDFGAFFYFLDLFRAFNHGMVWYHVALAFVQSQLLVKIVVAFFIFLPAAAPAGIVPSYFFCHNSPSSVYRNISKIQPFPEVLIHLIRMLLFQ